MKEPTEDEKEKEEMPDNTKEEPPIEAEKKKENIGIILKSKMLILTLTMIQLIGSTIILKTMMITGKRIMRRKREEEEWER